MARSREPTIIHLDTETIRAKIGIDELYDKPTLVRLFNPLRTPAPSP